MSTQSMEALANANRIRFAMARRKREISTLPRREALRLVAALLEHPPPVIARMRVMQLLCAPPRVGPALVDRWMNRAGIPHATAVRPVARLSERQRSVMASVLRQFADESRGMR